VFSFPLKEKTYLELVHSRCSRIKKEGNIADRQKINIFISKGKIHWHYIKMVFRTTESLLQRYTSCPIYFQGDKPNQLDTKGLPPAQGRNPSLNGRFCHVGAGSSLMKIGKGLVATRKPDLLWLKLAKEGSETLQVTPAFPKWIISDKQQPTSFLNTHQLLQFVPPA